MALIAVMIVLLAVSAWGAITHFLVYGISVEFGLGFGVGMFLTMLLFAIAYRFDHPKPKQEIVPPRKQPRY